MGTRADFYLGRGVDAEWLGSIAWDGYPRGLPKIMASQSEADFREALAELAERKDWTHPSMGWPWPSEDSQTTDYAYAWDDGKVWVSPFGHGWHDRSPEDEEWDEEIPKVEFPNMKHCQNVAMGTPRDSIILLAVKRPIEGGGEE